MSYKQKLRVLQEKIERIKALVAAPRLRHCDKIPRRLVPATWDGLDLLLRPANIGKLRARLRTGYSLRADFHPGIFIRYLWSPRTDTFTKHP